jgi:predicted NodU family carbamoyl transferase
LKYYPVMCDIFEITNQPRAKKIIMNILGISAFYHDSAACLVRDGDIVAAAQEERFTRKKHDFSFPLNAIDYCLEAGKIKSESLDFIAFYDKPFIKFERILRDISGFCSPWHSIVCYGNSSLDKTKIVDEGIH